MRKHIAYPPHVAELMHMPHALEARKLADRFGLTVNAVTWEDNGRSKHSVLGPCITDMTLQSAHGDAAMPVVRPPNYEDLTWDVPMDKITLMVGNEHGEPLRQVTLREYLGAIDAHLSKPKDWQGPTSLLAPERDSHVLMSAQACFLPMPTDDKDKEHFNVAVRHYQSTPYKPGMLVLVATNDGTSAQVTSGGVDTLWFNRSGMRCAFGVQRLGAYRLEQGRADDGSAMNAEEKVKNAIVVIQVPLKRPADSGAKKNVKVLQNWGPPSSMEATTLGFKSGGGIAAADLPYTYSGYVKKIPVIVASESLFVDDDFESAPPSKDSPSGPVKMAPVMASFAPTPVSTPPPMSSFSFGAGAPPLGHFKSAPTPKSTPAKESPLGNKTSFDFWNSSGLESAYGDDDDFESAPTPKSTPAKQSPVGNKTSFDFWGEEPGQTWEQIVQNEKSTSSDAGGSSHKEERPESDDMGFDLFGDYAPSTYNEPEKPKPKPEQRAVENGIVSVGPPEGPFRELPVAMKLERDPRFPVRVTLQYYKTSSTGRCDEAAMAEIAGQMKQARRYAERLGSLVVTDKTARPTEVTAEPPAPPPAWWADFWAVHGPRYAHFKSADDAAAYVFKGGRFAKLGMREASGEVHKVLGASVPGAAPAQWTMMV